MTTKCPYCDFSRKKPLDLNMLRILSEPDLPFEDYLLWQKRSVQAYGLKEYHGVQVHIGRMHKTQYIIMEYIFSDEELVIINHNEDESISAIIKSNRKNQHDKSQKKTR